jgi:DNA uptake protein ComE-like DNA-binding protein
MKQNWLSSRFNPKLQQLRCKLLKDPYYRFQTGEEILLAVQLGIQINPNNAMVDDWLRLPGLSIHQARSLVELTCAGVKFYCIEDIAAALSIPVQRLLPLQPILHFVYYDDESLEIPAELVNPNTASVESLLKIPFIDINLAQVIVQNRESFGSFRSLADFQKRLNLSTDVLAQLMYYLRL